MQAGLSAASAPQIEASLQAATRLNPEFAPAFDQLAVFYARQNTNLDQAYLLSLTAAQLEPFNVGFRMNAANLLMQMKRPTDALAVLQVAARTAKDPAQLTMILREQDLIQQVQAGLQRQEQQEREAIARSQGAIQSWAQPDGPLTDSKPAEPPENPRHGPQRTAIGTLADVECSWPAIMHLKLVGGPKPLSLRTRNYYKVAYSALNFQPSSNLKPCEDLKTTKAKVVYFEDEDASAAGQIIAIELRK